MKTTDRTILIELIHLHLIAFKLISKNDMNKSENNEAEGLLSQAQKRLLR